LNVPNVIQPNVIQPNVIQPSSDSMPLSPAYVRFWGVRGNIPTPGEAFLQYGGNTACVELWVNGLRLVFDGGTGLKDLGNFLVDTPSSPDPVSVHLFFTHSHWDRIQGFPFFKPAFSSGNDICIYGSIAINGASIKKRLMDQMTRPGFPVPLHFMKANLSFFDLSPGATTELAGPMGTVAIETSILNSADSSLGYRVSWDDQVLVYATDVEHRNGHLNPALLHLAENANLLIYDVAHPYYSCQDTYDRIDFQSKLWQTALTLMDAAQVEQLILFHHDPWCTDQELAQIEAELRIHCPKGRLAQEGMTFKFQDPTIP
jgi:ribonuclease Z